MDAEKIAELRKAAEHVIAGIELSDPADVGDILFQRSDKPLYLSNCYRVAEALPALLALAERAAELELRLASEEDGTLVDEAWLASVCESYGTTHFRFGEQMFVYLSGVGNWCAVPYAAGGFQVKSRGIVRTLCRALGIPLQDTSPIPDPLAAVRGLVEKWRANSKPRKALNPSDLPIMTIGEAFVLKRCAEELEAILEQDTDGPSTEAVL